MGDNRRGGDSPNPSGRTPGGALLGWRGGGVVGGGSPVRHDPIPYGFLDAVGRSMGLRHPFENVLTP